MYIKVKRIMGIHAAYDTFGEATEKEHKFGKTETKGRGSCPPFPAGAGYYIPPARPRFLFLQRLHYTTHTMDMVSYISTFQKIKNCYQTKLMS